MNGRIVLAALLAASIPALAAAQSISPYPGQDARDIKSLSPDEVKAYLAGEGMGFAKAGELNHYPGPKHVLAMADRLGLSAEQKARVGAIAVAMTSAAVPLGRQIVDAERDLDRRFADGTIDDASLRNATARIANLQGALRDVHLTAHLQTRKLLSPDQVAMYDQMRGYADGSTDMHHHS